MTDCGSTCRLAGIIHGFCVAKAPRALQVGPLAAIFKIRRSDTRQSASESDEQARSEVVCGRRLDRKNHECSGLGRAKCRWFKGYPLLIALGVMSACLSAAPDTTADAAGDRKARWVHGSSASIPQESSRWSTSATAREAHLTGDDSQILVEAKLNGQVSGVFLLDTGATYCVITPEMAQRLGVAHEGQSYSIALETPAGRIEAPMTTLRTVEVARARAAEVPAVIYPAVQPPLSGIIGLSFLHQFEFSIDTRRRVLRLKPF